MILNIIAIVIFIVIGLTTLNFWIVLFKNGFNWKNVNGYFKSAAIDLDKFGNRYYRAFWNATLSTGGYYFGKKGETISSVLGKKQKEKTLTKTGKALVWILDKIEKDHCKNSINYNL